MGYTKKQWIEKFGEDYYYNVVVPRNKKSAKRWSETKGKEYKEKNKEKCNEYYRKYAHSEKGKETHKKRNQAAYKDKEKKSKILRLRYFNLDKRKGLNTGQVVSSEWILENIINSKCIYCGESDWTKLGCDRIDNSKPHTEDNCVCSCQSCNMSRGNRRTVQEQIEYTKNKIIPTFTGRDY